MCILNHGKMKQKHFTISIPLSAAHATFPLLSAVKSASLESDLAYFEIMEHELRRLRVILTIPTHYETITDYR